MEPDEDAQESGETPAASAFGYRGSSKTLHAEDLAEIECFTELASLYVRAGMPVRRAWAAANAWIDEHEPGEMPECIPYPKSAGPRPMPPPRTLGLPATPPERLLPEPTDVDWLVPQEKPVDLDGEDLGVDEPLLFEHPVPPAPPASQAAPEQGPPRRLRVRGSAPSSRAACGVVHRDVKPQKETRMFQDDVLEALEKAGNATAKEIAENIGADPTKTANALRALLVKGQVNRHGGHKGASWEVGTGISTAGEAPPLAKKPKTMADVAQKAAKKERAPKTNGASNGHAPPVTGMQAAVDMMRQALTADFEAKMSALNVLLGGPSK